MQLQIKYGNSIVSRGIQLHTYTFWSTKVTDDMASSLSHRLQQAGNIGCERREVMVLVGSEFKRCIVKRQRILMDFKRELRGDSALLASLIDGYIHLYIHIIQYFVKLVVHRNGQWLSST